MENQTQTDLNKQKSINVSQKTVPSRKRGRPRLQPVNEEPEEFEHIPTEDPENDTESDSVAEIPHSTKKRSEAKRSEAADEQFPEDEPAPEEIAVGNILDFLDQLDGGYEHAVTVHVYRFPTNKPESMLGREDRIKVGTMPLNPVNWEEEVHAALPKGGYAYIEFRWNQDIWIGVDRVKKAGTPAKGVYRRFDPLPFVLDPSAPQHVASHTAAPAQNSMDYFEMQRQALVQAQQQSQMQFEFFLKMQSLTRNDTLIPIQPPSGNPRVEALEGKLLDIAFETLQAGPAPTVERAARAGSIYDTLGNIGMALINRIPEPILGQIVLSAISPTPGFAPPPPTPPAAPAHDATSPAIETDAQDAKIVRYPLASTASFDQKYQRVLAILYEDWTGNRPVAETAEAITELFDQHPEVKATLQTMLADPVDALKAKLLTAYQPAGQEVIKKSLHADAWLEDLKKSLSQ